VVQETAGLLVNNLLQDDHDLDSEAHMASGMYKLALLES
jgi:hypothetical protein